MGQSTGHMLSLAERATSSISRRRRPSMWNLGRRSGLRKLGPILLGLLWLVDPSIVQPAEQAVPAVEGDATSDPARLGPRKVVEAFHEVLLQSMREGDALGFEGRYDLIVGSLDESFDLPFMARVSVGAAWKTLDNDQRLEFVALSRQLSASNYADNFDSYGGQTFLTHSDEPAARGTIVVKTELVQPDDDNVTFDYRMRDAGKGWRIIDVQLDGKVSEITLRRADYRSVIERKGFPQLVVDIEKKIRKHSKD
jgi:phospholipid transport system substrate-binding protein